MRWFRELGLEVERAWLDADRDEEAFPELAAQALARWPASEHFDRSAFLEAELDPAAPARRERAPLGAFGQPGVTVHFGRDFVIEVYFWASSIAGVHDHPFRGVFAILEGESVHVRYAFEEHERVGARLRIGALRADGIELLSAGDVRPFSWTRHPLIHTLIHVPSPAISMVIRTIRSTEYWTYFPPALAILNEAPDEVIARQLALLEGLRQSGDPSHEDRLERYLARSSLETCVRALAPAWGHYDEASRARWLAAVRGRHGARTDALAAALSRTVRLHQINTLRGQLRALDDRFVATALLCCETRSQVLELVGKRHDDPQSRLQTFVAEVGPHAVGGDEVSVDAARLLVDGLGRDAVVGSVEQRFGADVAREHLGQIERFCEESVFAALARG